jgi:hypothetical protein
MERSTDGKISQWKDQPMERHGICLEEMYSIGKHFNTNKHIKFTFGQCRNKMAKN